MKQVFAMRREAAGWSAVLAVAVLAGPSSAHAAPIRGTVEAPAKEVRAEQLGFTRTKVAGAADAISQGTVDVALFLKVEESLPIPKPEVPTKVVVRGMKLAPEVVSCAVDTVVEFVNEEAEPVTLKVEEVELRIGAGETRAFECSVGEAQRTVRVKEWPHVRALLYVGEVGVAAEPDERGAFALSAPNGSYSLQIVTSHGVVAERPVEVKGATVNLGVIDLGSPSGGEAEAP